MNWEYPTRTDEYCDKATKHLLTVLLVLLVLHTFWAKFFLAEQYEIVPQEYVIDGTINYWVYQPQTDLPLITQSEYDEKMRPYHRTSWFGILGILAYLGLRFMQPWYRARLRDKIGRLSG